MTGKAKIIRVGIFVTQYACPPLNLDKTTFPYGWHFDYMGWIPPVEVRDGVYYYGGWTLEELHEVAARPMEFVELP